MFSMYFSLVAFKKIKGKVVPTGKISGEECIFVYITQHFEDRFNKDSLLPSYLLAFLPAVYESRCDLPSFICLLYIVYK